MTTMTYSLSGSAEHPIDVRVEYALENRNRLTSFFRILLAVPHLILVGGPIAAAITLGWGIQNAFNSEVGFGGGALGVGIAAAAMVSWFAIVFTGRHPAGLWKLAAAYLRWRVWVATYASLLRDEYPPFAEGEYPASLQIAEPPAERDRWTVGFRLILALPHILIVWALGVMWFLTTLLAWASIILTESYPRGLYDFGVSVLRWNTRVDAYLLLLHDEYPPFSFD